MTPPAFVPPGYRVLRPLSERPGSSAFLALNPDGHPCCLKVQTSHHPGTLEALARVRERLAPILNSPGFILLRSWGIDPLTGVLWEEMELADDASRADASDPGTFEPSLYTPLTLAQHVAESGPVPTHEVLAQGLALARALERLHARGLYHRDIKPANILLRNRQWVLADYGSVGEAGAAVEFPGTEGYMPPDGLGSPALDVFALGRTLYEAWTGQDRFRFPSLPKGHVHDPAWARHGWLLNDILLHAGNPRPSNRHPSAAALARDLAVAHAGRRRLSRRAMLAAAALPVAAVAAAYVWRNLPPYRAVWRRLPPKRFGMESWKGNELTCDWRKRTIYSTTVDSRGFVLHAYDLKAWTHQYARLEPAANIQGGHALLSPDGTQLHFMQDVSGEVHVAAPPGVRPVPLEIQLLDDLSFVGPVYWNPCTHRIGRMGGYGNFNTHRRRSELDLQARRWIAIEEPSDGPWPRYEHLLFPRPNREQWFLFGGLGNPSGRQGERIPGLRNFDGRYYTLNDLWSLDLKTGAWTSLLPVQRWNPIGLARAIYHPATESVAFLTGSTPTHDTEAAFHLWQGDPGRNPIPLSNRGERIAMHRFWTLLVEPETQHLWVFADEGVFAVALEKG